MCKRYQHIGRNAGGGALLSGNAIETESYLHEFGSISTVIMQFCIAVQVESKSRQKVTAGSFI
jgi:hypothetical protein